MLLDALDTGWLGSQAGKGGKEMLKEVPLADSYPGAWLAVFTPTARHGLLRVGRYGAWVANLPLGAIVLAVGWLAVYILGQVKSPANRAIDLPTAVEFAARRGLK
jgi:hypothetical protein